MNEINLKKINSLYNRYKELEEILINIDPTKNQKNYIKYSKEHIELKPIIDEYRLYSKYKVDIESNSDLLIDQDKEIKKLAQDENDRIKNNLLNSENKLKDLLSPADKNDKKNVFLEIRAGTGGDEASLFAGDLFRMYFRYAEKNKWNVDIISSSITDNKGYKEIITKISGLNVYGKTKFESGVHRVQRVPETESKGRLHTSTCTVAVLLEPGELDDIDIKPSDVRIDTYRASGAGGQHVNRTESAVRITYLPTNTVVECQDERSQHKNKAKAFSLLKAKVLSDKKRIKQKKEESIRRNLVGSGDRSERIRTYNYPQGRITDHRINLTLYNLNDILEGNIDEIVKALIYQNKLNNLQ